MIHGQGNIKICCSVAYYTVICSLSASTTFTLHYLIKDTIFRRKKIELNVCFDFLYKRVWNISHSEKNSARYHVYIILHVKYPLFLSDFNRIWILSSGFRKIFKYKISWKSFYFEHNCFMRTEERTERHDGIKGRFPQFCEKASKVSVFTLRGLGRPL
jgi:hypothetical protein